MPAEKRKNDEDEIYHKKLLKDNSNSSSEESISSKSIFAQCLVTGAVMLSSASCGMPTGYSAILLPQLKSTNGTLQIDDNIGSWIASVHSASTPLGSLLSAVLMEKVGRKLTLQVSAVPLIVGWLLIAFAQSHNAILLGRLIAGMSAGLTAAPGQVLIGEISEPHVRGIFTSVPFASYSFGILLVYALGSWFDWRLVAGSSTLLPLIAATLFFVLPESPVWLVKKNRDEDAKRALVWLRGGNNIQAKQELQQLVSRIDSQQNPGNSKSAWKQMLEPRVIKPFIILNIFNIMQIFSGTYLIVFYAVDILSNISGGEIDHFLAAVLTACVRFIFTIVASILLAFVGRRTLALASGIGTGISALCLGTFLYFQADCSGSGYFAAFCVLIYVAANTIGFMILPGVLLGELYPANIRGFIGGLTFTSFNFILFVITKVFPLIRDLIGVHGVFWVFSLSSFFASIFLYLMLPETKGKTLEEIEDYFGQKNILWVVNNNKSSKLPNA
ncbi:PREDICTED: facilitated trehalose transporter Tret1 [Nicrophorus vespilloides]|uniref:Facilitated trehalose transporter Tret1 n=1 Tax=Nicrophorus vespilloides TaxID=110193 RepID=A0ABM1N1E5_NICVS|nr:PREDICTED: facilitated trehalose transporter Tret1 [Nicrophorus vespilloides]